MTFYEKAERHEANRKLAHHIKVVDARLANETVGVCVFYGYRPMILTADEAYNLANRIADVLESR